MTSLHTAAVLLLAVPAAGGPEREERDPEAVAAAVHAAHLAVREGRLDSARTIYVDAAARQPELRDWLLLRAAAITPDSGVRAAMYAELTVPAAIARVPATEATARERAGDLAGAVALYDSLGRRSESFRLRLRMAGDSGRSAVRSELLEYIQEKPSTADAAAAADLLLGLGATTPAEALAVARVASASRQYSRAVAQYLRGLTAKQATPEDRLAYATALARTGRHREAIATFARVTGTSAPAARYERARSLLRIGDRAAALSTLWQLVEQHDGHSSAPRALLLAGDLTGDKGGRSEARGIWLGLAERYPASPSARRARFLAALVAFEEGEYTQAAREWSMLEEDYPSDGGAAAAGYWAGRAWMAAGAGSRAREAWRRVLQRDSLSYYAVKSAERLEIEPWQPAPADDLFVPDLWLDSAATRLGLLRRFAMTPELGWERDTIAARAAGMPERLLAAARALHDIGERAMAQKLGWQALAAGAAGDARTFRIIFPLPERERIAELAAQQGVDPAIVAALVRQESSWEPRATSSAGARGLMQVMPATGARLAKRLGLDAWSAEQLYDPAVNLELGTRHLAASLERHSGDLTRALAAYNAGETRVAAWVRTVPPGDHDLFIERIPFAETRDYVRVVQRNVALYRALYPS